MYNPDAIHRLADFIKASPVKKPATSGSSSIATQATGAAIRIDSLDDLDKWNVPDHTKLAVIDGPDPERHPSRSEAVHAVACELVRRGVPDGVIFSVLTDPDFQISSRPREKGDAHTWGEIANAKAKVADVDFQCSGKHGEGPPVRNLYNARLAVLKLGIRPAFDEFRQQAELQGHSAERVNDRAMSELRQFVLSMHGFDCGKDHLEDAVRQLAFENAYDPVVEYLERIKWDGTPRLETWMCEYLGADDSLYVRGVGRVFLIGAVRRARSPGCKFDTIVVLEGEQGTGKSTALSVLAGADFFSDEDVVSRDSKERIELMRGVWIQELAELEGLSKRDVSSTKAFASRRADKARLAYDRHVTEQPRRCIFAGTVNESEYLKDSTGNRRWLAVETSTIDLDRLAEDRDQLLAEAAHCEAEGESIVLPQRLWQVAAQEAEMRVETDPWCDTLQAFDDPTSAHFVKVRIEGSTGKKKVRSSDVLAALGVEVERRTPAVGRRAAAAMRSLGWTKPKNTVSFGNEKAKGFWKVIGDAEVAHAKACRVTNEDQTEIQL